MGGLRGFWILVGLVITEHHAKELRKSVNVWPLPFIHYTNPGLLVPPPSLHISSLYFNPGLLVPPPWHSFLMSPFIHYTNPGLPVPPLSIHFTNPGLPVPLHFIHYTNPGLQVPPPSLHISNPGFLLRGGWLSFERLGD